MHPHNLTAAETLIKTSIREAIRSFSGGDFDKNLIKRKGAARCGALCLDQSVSSYDLRRNRLSEFPPHQSLADQAFSLNNLSE